MYFGKSTPTDSQNWKTYSSSLVKSNCFIADPFDFMELFIKTIWIKPCNKQNN